MVKIVNKSIHKKKNENNLTKILSKQNLKAIDFTQTLKHCTTSNIPWVSYILQIVLITKFSIVGQINYDYRTQRYFERRRGQIVSRQKSPQTKSLRISYTAEQNLPINFQRMDRPFRMIFTVEQNLTESSYYI